MEPMGRATEELQACDLGARMVSALRARALVFRCSGV